MSVENNGWIRVEDRCPKNGDYVLALDASDVKYFTHSMGINRFKDGVFIVPDDDYSDPPTKITHWQPLPEPPKSQHHSSDVWLLMGKYWKFNEEANIFYEVDRP